MERRSQEGGCLCANSSASARRSCSAPPTTSISVSRGVLVCVPCSCIWLLSWSSCQSRSTMLHPRHRLTVGRIWPASSCLYCPAGPLPPNALGFVSCLVINDKCDNDAEQSLQPLHLEYQLPFATPSCNHNMVHLLPQVFRPWFFHDVSVQWRILELYGPNNPNPGGSAYLRIHLMR